MRIQYRDDASSKIATAEYALRKAAITNNGVEATCMQADIYTRPDT